MKLKKELGKRIVADFHSGEAAEQAAQDWSRMFQKKELPEEIEEVRVRIDDISWSAPGIQLGSPKYPGVRLDKLLVKCGLADSVADATRKIKAGAVRIGNNVEHSTHILAEALPARLPISVTDPPIPLSVRAGKKIKMAVVYKD